VRTRRHDIPVQRARAVPWEDPLSPVLATFAIFANFANFEDFKFSSGDTNTVMKGFALPVRRVNCSRTFRAG
jgi:hypothetical protein